MSWSVCEYCGGSAELNVGDLWLCHVHGRALATYAGGLALLLEMPPEARRSLADSMLPLYTRDDVFDPARECGEQADLRGR